MPADYDTVLMGVAVQNGATGAALINQNRALGAPVVLEVGEKKIGVWTVGAEADETTKTDEFDEHEFRRWAEQNSDRLNPTEFLRTKGLKLNEPTFYETSLFAGLIPELEERIGSVLDPRLTAAFKAGLTAYQSSTGGSPPEARLFKVAFWLLTGKVFFDRQHPNFISLGESASADEVLNRVADHYAAPLGDALNRQTRDAIFRHVWSEMDFRHLSVDALSQIWSRTLVTPQTRKRLGIYRTRRSLVRYIVDRIPFCDFAPEERYVLEPCSGSAGFLVAAMERMRDCPDTPPEASRHAYFQGHLTGYENDSFGVEISQLCLTLADYPHKNGWRMKEEDVFTSPSFPDALRRARIVLCNPPFRKFTKAQQRKYGVTHKTPPAELLERVLRYLHPDGVLGFVLPRTFLNGGQYKKIRATLAGRFMELEVLWLPDKGWGEVAPETAVLIAKSPKRLAEGAGVPRAASAAVSYVRVREQDWADFEARHATPLGQDRSIMTACQAEGSLAGLVLRPVWDYLERRQKVGEIARIRKGIEWKNQEENRHLLVGDEPFGRHSKLGIPPGASPFFAFVRPPTKHLNFAAEYQYRPNSFVQPWDRPKVILNKSSKSRGPWRLAAFADFDGLACYETFIAAWPTDEGLTVPLAAVLNGPVANSFVWEHSGKREIKLRTIRDIPFPVFSPRQVSELIRLVSEYATAADGMREWLGEGYSKADGLLREIDAVVLDAYRLPPRIEKQLLDFFNGDKRQVPFEFDNYYPKDYGSYIPLGMYLSPKYRNSTPQNILENAPVVTDQSLLEALREAE